jgi:hypothetical protein
MLPDPGGHDMVLRRGRTSPDPFLPQYRSVLVEECVWLREEVVPLQPLALIQNARLACHRTQQREEKERFRYFLWIGRQKTASAQAADAGLEFDALE